MSYYYVLKVANKEGKKSLWYLKSCEYNLKLAQSYLQTAAAAAEQPGIV